jgi:hypothetical protein
MAGGECLGICEMNARSRVRHVRFIKPGGTAAFATAICCIEAGLVGGNGFATDASLIKADANKQRSADGSEAVDWRGMAATRRPIREYLDTLDEAAWGAARRPAAARCHGAAAAAAVRPIGPRPRRRRSA